jgi:hypothetical protein
MPTHYGFKDFTPVVVDSRTRGQTTPVSGSKHKITSVCRQSGETVLHKAARLGYPDVAEEKIRQGADIHVRDNAGWSALHEACSYSQYDVAEVLLKYGADPNCVSESGIRPLHDAVEKNNVDIIRLLLSYGSDPNIASYNGLLPIDCTNNTRVKKLIQGYCADMMASEGHQCEKENGWSFGGSCDLLDADNMDIFENLPPEDQHQSLMEFETSEQPIPNSYYLPHKNEHNVIVGYRNYFKLDDMLTQSNLTRTSFTKKFTNAHILTLTQHEMREHLRHEDFNNLMSDGGVEFVYLKKQPLKKLLSLKTVKIHC